MGTNSLPRLVMLAAVLAAPLQAQGDLNDLEMAHAALTASEIDIAYAHLALAFSKNPDVRVFAETMIRDHGAVNAQVVALAARLRVEAQDNRFSQALLSGARETKARLARLRGADFDRQYVENELAYHKSVNGVVAKAFIPNAKNAEVKQAFTTALSIFRGHERHAARLDRELRGGM